MYGFENDKLTVICYTNKSEDTLLSFRFKIHIHTHLSHAHTHTLLPLHGPLGFVVAKSLNKLRNDLNWKMSNGDSSAVPSQYGDDEIWFFEVRCITRAEWLPPLWLKGGHPLSRTACLCMISHGWHEINAIFTSAVPLLFFAVTSSACYSSRKRNTFK